MFRKITGTAASTVRFATALPVGVARSVLERVTHRDSEDATASAVSPTQERQQPPQREPEEQAAESVAAAERGRDEPASAAATKKSTPAKARKKAGTPKAGTPKAGTPKAGATPHDDAKPDVVLAVDALPEEIEPPIDVVGQALAAEQAEEARRPKQPQPVHVEDDNPVVYSTTSDDD